MSRKRKRKNSMIPGNGISSDLGRILRPQAASRWMLPNLAAITPQYIEMTLRGALAGSHVQAWELFDLMEDTWPRLRKAALELKNGVRNLKLNISAYQDEEEESTTSADERRQVVSAALRSMRPNAAADENDLESTIFDIMDGWFKGVVVLETDWHLCDAGALGQIVAPRTTHWVHPTCYAFSMDGELGLRLGSRGSTSYQPLPSHVGEFPPNKFLVGICKTKSGSALGGALLRPLAWWWCAANFSADWLLNLAQIFGLPFRMANYQPNAPQATIDAICSMLQNMGSAGWAAFPQGTTIDFKEANINAQHTPQADMMDRADKACDLLVLGQTLTSDTGGGGRGGGSLALGKVHEGVKGEIIQAAGKYTCSVLEQLSSAILILNYGDDNERPEVKLESEEVEDLRAKAETISALVKAGAGRIIGLDWIGKTFGIPKPCPDEETLGSREVPPQVDDEPDADEPMAAREALLAAASMGLAPHSGEVNDRLLEISAIEDDAQFIAALSAFAQTL